MISPLPPGTLKVYRETVTGFSHVYNPFSNIVHPDSSTTLHSFQAVSWKQLPWWDSITHMTRTGKEARSLSGLSAAGWPTVALSSDDLLLHADTRTNIAQLDTGTEKGVSGDASGTGR